MGRLFGIIGIDGFISYEKHQHLANNKFNGMLVVCGLWLYVGHVLAYNNFKCLHIGSQYFLFNQTLPKQLISLTLF
jgi:hypothetical protein